MHTCIYAYMHICIHAYMHTCIGAHRHTCSIALMLSNVHYVMGGGWDLCTQSVNASAGDRLTGMESDLTYLTYLLTYLPV